MVTRFVQGFACGLPAATRFACAIYGLPAARGMRFGGPFIAALEGKAAMEGSSRITRLGRARRR
jgi:hypothetical protein